MSKPGRPPTNLPRGLPLRIEDSVVSGTDKRGRNWCRAERREVMEERIFRIGGGGLPGHVIRRPLYGRVLARTSKRKEPKGLADALRTWEAMTAELGPVPEVDPPFSLKEAIRYLVPFSE